MMLAGFRAMDEHFLRTPLEQNLPVIMALLGLWYGNAFGFATHAVLPYSQELARFPAYLQQLDMESNGKSARIDGTRVTYDTGPIVWGAAGTNGQHAYYQLLHQGTRIVPADLIGFVNPTTEIGDHQDLLMANLFAQAEAMAFGKTREEVVAADVPKHQVDARVFEGNRPTSILLARPADAADPGRPRRPLRAQGVRAGRDLGHRLVRPVGRGAGQGPRDEDRGRAHLGQGTGRRGTRCVHERPHPPLPGPPQPPGVVARRGGQGGGPRQVPSGRWPIRIALCYHSPSRLEQATLARAFSTCTTRKRRSWTLARTPRKWQGARTPSGLKRVRQAERRHAILQPRRSAAKTLVAKAVTVAETQPESADVGTTLAEAISALDRAAKSGAIHPNAAARRKSRLTRKVNAAVGGTAVVGGHVAKSTWKAAAAKAAKARIAAGKASRRRAPRPPPARPAPHCRARPAPRRPRPRPPARRGRAGQGDEGTGQGARRPRPRRPRRPRRSRRPRRRRRRPRPRRPRPRRPPRRPRRPRRPSSPRTPKRRNAPVTDRGVSIHVMPVRRQPASGVVAGFFPFVSRNTTPPAAAATTVAMASPSAVFSCWVQ